jgi:hypothetical protein
VGREKDDDVRGTLALAGGALLAALPAAGATSARAPAELPIQLELVGQVVNTAPGVTPQLSTQFGYLSYVNGLRAFTGDNPSESTALFTFFIQATTQRVLVNGPLRVVTRSGTFTVYRDPSANARFASPETFRDGTRILVATFRQQLVQDTVAQTFSTLNRNTVTATRVFPNGARTVRLGSVGTLFNTALTGHQNMPGPPNAYFAGYTLPQPRLR